MDSRQVLHSSPYLPCVPLPSSRRRPPNKLDSGYVLGPDDQIVIHAIDSPEISDKPFLIGMNGNITLPLIGRVQAGGLTVEQLEAELNTGLKKYMHDPQVSVTVAEFRSQPVSVFGSVARPG